MTQELTNVPEIIDVPGEELSFDDKARSLLLPTEYEDMNSYIKSGNHEIALSTANKFFELYINGNEVAEIHKLNPAFPVSAIHWCRVKYDWDNMRRQYILTLQRNIVDKVVKAQLEATSLYADIISAASKKHGEKLKKYIQTGDEKYLDKALDIHNVAQLQKAVDGLQKITNQDKNFTVTNTNEQKLTVDVNVNSDSNLSTESASKILAVVAEERRKKDLINQKG